MNENEATDTESVLKAIKSVGGSAPRSMLYVRFGAYKGAKRFNAALESLVKDGILVVEVRGDSSYGRPSTIFSIGDGTHKPTQEEIDAVNGSSGGKISTEQRILDCIIRKGGSASLTQITRGTGNGINAQDRNKAIENLVAEGRICIEHGFSTRTFGPAKTILRAISQEAA